MRSLFLSMALFLVAASASAAEPDYSRLDVLGGDWAASARADRLSTMEVTIVLELAQTWEASNRGNQFDPYVTKLGALYARTAQNTETLRPVLHGAACWHSRHVAAARGADAAPPRILWTWISPRNDARCPD